MLNKTDLNKLISTTNQALGLPLAVIEKDYYVTQINNANASTENTLSKLHRHDGILNRKYR